MATETKRIRVAATWWETATNPETELDSAERAEIDLSYESDVVYIDGLRDGHYLSIPLSSLADAIAKGADC